MNEAAGLRMSHVEDHRGKAREVILRHGDNAKDYVTARIEACETAGEKADAANWRNVLHALSEGETHTPGDRRQFPAVDLGLETHGSERAGRKAC